MVSSSRNKIVVFSFISLAIILLVECQSTGNKTNSIVKDSTTCSKTKSLNPNGDSELALLMRSMYDSLVTMNEQVKQGRVPTNFPRAFLKINTATPSDSSTKHVSFTAFSADYLNSLKKMYESPKEELKTNYNSLVQKCANCHQASCPGPLKKIYKLKLDV